MNKSVFAILSVALLSGPVLAQETETPIADKFSEVIESSNTFKGYKVVDQNELNSLQEETFDYIQNLRAEIERSEEAMNSQQQNIVNLEEELAAVNSQLEQLQADKDSIAFLGMPFDKSSYKSIMWGIVGVLVLALAFFMYRFKKSQSVTVEARKRMEETEKEFEAYRAKALEKEQRLGRMLQDERNKLAQKVG